MCQGSTTPFRDQVVSLQALPPEEADPALALLCPIRALRHYVDRTQSFRTSDQLFVCHGGRQERECRLQAEDGPLDSGCHHHGLSGTGCAFPVQVESWLVAPRWQIFVGLRAGRPLTHSLDSIAFVWNRFPPVFSPQTGRSTVGPRFRVGLLKTAPESPTVDPVELLHPLGSWTWRSVRHQALTRWIPENW